MPFAVPLVLGVADPEHGQEILDSNGAVGLHLWKKKCFNSKDYDGKFFPSLNFHRCYPNALHHPICS